MKKYLLAAVITVFAYAQIAFSADINEPEYLIFIGNPGVGKSTLINSLVGRHVAAAGVNPGVGLTKFFSAYEHNGKYYMDTPGLADMELREQAAREIESALKKDGKYRIFFMINLSAGRVMPEDVTTINTVMDAVKSKNTGFNIIVNKLTTKEKNLIRKDTTNMASIYAQINSGKHNTDSIRYIDNDRDVDDEKTEFIKIDAQLNRFIFQESKLVKIASQDIGKIETNEFEAIRAQFQESMAFLQKEIAAGNERFDELKKKMATIQTSLDDAEKERKKAEAELKEANKKLAKSSTEAAEEKEKREKAEKELEEKKGECNLL